MNLSLSDLTKYLSLLSFISASKSLTLGILFSTAERASIPAKAGLKKLFVCHHTTDPTLEVPTQNILLNLNLKKKTFPKVTNYFNLKFNFQMHV